MSSFHNIRAVTFDVGGTLLEPWPSVGVVYAEVAEECGWPGISPEILDRQFAGAWRTRQTFDYSRAAWREIVGQSFSGLVPPSALAGLFPSIYERFAQRNAWRLFEDVRPTLAALRERGFKLAVISNWDERLDSLLRQFELDSCFDVILISTHVGVHKPSPEIFLRAAAQLCLPPAALLHVGDGMAEDFEGASRAGLRALHLERGSEARTDGRITTLMDLVSLLPARPD